MVLRKIAGFLMVACVPLVLASCSDDDSMPTDPDPSTTQKIEILSGQTPDNGMLRISRVVSNQSGWVVIHRDVANQPVMTSHLGVVQVNSGTSTDVTITLDSGVSDGERLWAVLYNDTGIQGQFEYNGATSPDQPVRVNNAIVRTPFSVQQTDPMLEVSDQMLNNSEVVVDRVDAAENGWVVIHASNATGSSAQVLGRTRVNAGSTMNVIVELDMSPENTIRNGDRLWARLYYDRGVEGTYEYPGPDAPVVFDGDEVMESFLVSAANAPTIVVENQSASNNEVSIALVNVTEPGWVVLYADNDESDGPDLMSPVGRTRVSVGTNTNLVVTVDGASVSQGAKLWAVLHADRGTIGTYEYPGVDEIIRVGLLGEMITDSFIIQ